MNKKLIIALFGAAGSGKDSLQKEIANQSPDLFHEIISSTTRPPREYEKNGIDYIFLTDEESNRNIQQNNYLEYAEFRGWRYGTLKTAIKKDCFNIGVFNISGVKQLLKLPHDQYQIIPIHVIVSDKIRLLRQLNREKNPDCDEIIRRYTTDAIDLAPDQIDFWHLDIYNDKDTIVNTAALIIKQIYEYELKYYLIRAE